MNRPRALFTSLATLLALLMPLEQAHCAWMGLEQQASAASMPASHECCAPAAPEQEPSGNCPDCSCLQLPSASVPAQVGSLDIPTCSPVTVVASTTGIPLSNRQAPAPALDVGSPPLSVDLGAHGLRAPPLSA